jgi:hypothetical protein
MPKGINSHCESAGAGRERYANCPPPSQYIQNSMWIFDSCAISSSQCSEVTAVTTDRAPQQIPCIVPFSSDVGSLDVKLPAVYVPQSSNWSIMKVGSVQSRTAKFRTGWQSPIHPKSLVKVLTLPEGICRRDDICSQPVPKWKEYDQTYTLGDGGFYIVCGNRDCPTSIGRSIWRMRVRVRLR